MTNKDLIDTKDIAALLGISRAHAVGRITKRTDFPKPTINLTQRLRRWDRRAVLAWAGLK